MAGCPQPTPLLLLLFDGADWQRAARGLRVRAAILARDLRDLREAGPRRLQSRLHHLQRACYDRPDSPGHAKRQHKQISALHNSSYIA